MASNDASRARTAGAEEARRIDPARLRRAFVADAWWGAAAGLWLATGLWRLLAGTEKATGYYLTNELFAAKMGLFVVTLALELWPMVTLVRWRRGRAPSEPAARRIATISYMEAALVVVMVMLAASLARGYGAH